MYITNYLIESQEEKKDIYSQVVHKTKDFPDRKDELFFCIMDEEDIIGYALVRFVAEDSSSLEELVLADAYRGKGIEIKLLRYMAYELVSAGKSWLVIDVEDEDIDPDKDPWLSGIVGLDDGGKLVIKIDGVPARGATALAGAAPVA